MFRNDSRFTHSADPDGRRVLTLVKPEGVLYDPPPGDQLFKEAQQIPAKEPRLSFMPGLPEKEISLPDPMVQQAIARTLAGVSSTGFQALTPKTMATVAEIAKTAPRSKAEALAAQEKQAAEARAAEEAQAAAEARAAEEARQAQAAQEAREAEDARKALEAEQAAALALQEAQQAQKEEEAQREEEARQPQEAQANADAEPAAQQVSASADSEAGLPKGSEAEADDAAGLAEGAEIEPVASAEAEVAEPKDLEVPQGMQLVSAEEIQQVFDEAYAQGREAGIAEAKPLQEESFQQGYEEGYAKGQASTRDEMEAEVQLAVEDLKDLTGRLATAARDTEAFFAPLLKLSLHLAEQLVRGDLRVSSQAIERLIQTALEEFDQDPTAPVLVRINPEDLERLKSHGAALPGNMTLRADPTLTLGSVRVQMNGALIEDLIEHRADALWASLTKGLDAGGPPPSFLQNVALIKEALDQVEPAVMPARREQKEAIDGASAVVLEEPGEL